MKLGERSITLLGILTSVIFTVLVLSHNFSGLTSPVDGVMHLSRARIIMKTFPYIPRWNPYWYFGIPLTYTYPTLSHTIIASVGWALHLSIPDNLHVLVMAFTYLCFSVGAVSTYFLAREMGLGHIGRLSSAILFVTSHNLIVYWILGSYANALAVLFSPIALVFFLRSVRRRKLLNIFLAGASFALVFLIYFYNGAILFLIMLALSIVMLVREPRLLFISRGPKKPPHYTLILPKVFISIMLVAAGFSAWWVLPFLTALRSAPSIPVAPPFSVPGGDFPIVGLIDELSVLLGIQDVTSLRTPGLEHFTLALLGCIILPKERKGDVILAFTGFITALVLGLSPWLRIPIEPISWARFQLFLSLFTAILGGHAIDYLRRFPERLWHHKKLEEDISKISPSIKRRIYTGLLVFMILLISIYPVVGTSIFARPSVKVPTSEESRSLERYAKPGERAGIDGGYEFNIYTDIGQSGGGSIESMYISNEYSYTFWYYIFHKHDPRFIQYFAKNYNVRFFYTDLMPGLNQTEPWLPLEVVNFNSSLVEFVDSKNILVLFIGERVEYSYLFISVALANPQEMILVYGGRYVGDYGLADLKRFNVVYLSGLIYRNDEDLAKISATLKDYVDGGGGVILDTGVLQRGGGISGIPEPFPITRTYISEINPDLNAHKQHPILEGVDLAVFNTEESRSISYAVEVRNGTETLVWDYDRPVIVLARSLGKILWNGLNLPYHININLNDQNLSAAESRLLVNMIRYVSAGKPDIKRRVSFDILGPEEILVHVTDADPQGALWVKMHYYPGWTARIGETGAYLRMFLAGPEMMLVFPDGSGDYTVRFYFDKTVDVQIGEAVSFITMGVFLAVIGYNLFIYLTKGGHPKLMGKGSSQKIQIEK